jgi:hypothetical protein
VRAITDWARVDLGARSDADIARELGCTPAAVAHQRWRRGIPAFAPLRDVDWSAVGLGMRTDSEIARDLGCSRSTVREQRRRLGIPVFAGLWLSQESERLPLRSVDEARVDAWLHWRGIPHEHEVAYGIGRLRADVRITPDGPFIEVAAGHGKGDYSLRHARKRARLEAAAVSVWWLTAELAATLYESCPLPLLATADRCCKQCQVAVAHLKRGHCQHCYSRLRRGRTCTRCTIQFQTASDHTLCPSCRPVDRFGGVGAIVATVLQHGYAACAQKLGVSRNALYGHLYRNADLEQRALLQMTRRITT